jgi:PmbA protein
MSAAPPTPLPDRADLEPLAHSVLEAAGRGGADAAQTTLAASRALTVSVRNGEVESVEFQRDRDLTVSVFVGQRTGSAGTSDFSAAGVQRAVQAALDIARASEEDACNGLADAGLMATTFPALDLDHPWVLSPEQAIERARVCEAAAFAADPRIRHSEGAGVDTREGVELYANTHGFIGVRSGTMHQLSCAAVAEDEAGMQRDYWYDSARCADDLAAAEAIGRLAGERAARRLSPRSLATRNVPVLFVPELARGLFGHFLGAISGGALYRRASFLLDHVGEPVFAPQVRVEQQPFLPRGAASTAFDHEGVAARPRVLVDGGVLQGYVLGSYSARRLGLQTTGNAGGVWNLVVQSGGQDQDALLCDMGNGLLVTELMGQGINLVTGDYSRGAAGFWVENGEIAYPVDRITIAGNLAQMFRDIAAVGSDVDTRGGIRTGSVLIQRLTVGGR